MRYARSISSITIFCIISFSASGTLKFSSSWTCKIIFAFRLLLYYFALPNMVRPLRVVAARRLYFRSCLADCKVEFIGGAGYTAGELIRLLLNHPEAEIVFVNSSSNAGNKITDVHEGLYGETDLTFTDELPLDEIDVLFFCTAHGDTRKFMESHNVPEDLKIIDLSMDYRIKSDDHDFIYGLPELNRRATCTAKHVANPGCFATCIQLGLLPLAKHLMLNGDIMVNAITGRPVRASSRELRATSAGATTT